MGKFTFPLIILVAIGALAAVFVLGNRGKTPEPQDPNLLSRAGVHWHPEIRVFAKGQEQRLAAGIGVNGTQMGEIHTHSDVPKIHYELAGPVYKDEATLGAFIKSWNPNFDGQATVTVNGNPTPESFNYQIKDGDKIEVRYE